MADYEEIPQQAIDSLLANPEKAGGFDSVFGKGRAAEVLASRDPQPEPKAPKTREMGWMETAWDATGRAVGAGAERAVNETFDAAESFDRWASSKLDEVGIPSRLQLVDKEGNFDIDLKYSHEVDMTQPSYGSVEIDMFKDPETLTGGLVSGVAQFGVGMLGAGKFTKLSGLRGAFVNGAIADAIVFDPNDKNVMGMLDEWGVETGAVGEALATNPDDPEYINRLRNVAEGVVAGGIVEAIGWGVKAARAKKAGDLPAAKKFKQKEAEALKPLDDALREQVVKDAEETKAVLFEAKEMFGDDFAKRTVDPDGQINMDLGDTPTVRPETPTAPSKNRIYLTPEKAEKIRLQSNLAKGVSLSERLTDLSWRSPNTMKDWDEIADEIGGVSAVLKEEITKAKGGDVQRLTTVQLKAAAAKRRLVAMGSKDTEQLITELQTTYKGDPDGMAAEMLAREDFARSLGEEVTKMAKAISDETFHPDAFPGYKNFEEFKMGFDNMLEVYSNVLSGNNANRSNIARTMRAMQVARKPTEGIQKILSDPGMFRDIETKARALADPANAGKPILTTTEKAMKKAHGWMDQINKFRINALLSGPGTQEVNIVSNVVNSFVIPTEQFLGGLSRGDRKMMVHATRTIQGYMAGLLDSVKSAGQAGWWNDAILDPHSLKLEDDMLLEGTSAYTKVVTLPSRALMTMDEFFKQSQYRGRVFADANAEATAKRLKGPERAEYIKKYLAESYDEAGAAIREDALLQSRRATFTEPLEPGLASMLQKAAIDHPTIRFVIPFIRTPINILSQTFQHAPILGRASKRFQADIKAGGVRAAQARGRQLIGTALVGIAGYMAAQGHIVGAGPSDPRIRKVWIKNNQPYSFRIPQEDGTVTFVSFARLEPLSNIFSIAADAVEIKDDKYNENEVNGVIHAMLLSVMDNSVNKTFTQGIYDAMSLFVGRPHEREAASKNFVASFVPNFLNQTNGDDALREARTYTDAILARTGFYNGVDPKRNVLGEPIIRTLPKYDPLGLTDEDNRVIDPVLEEITRAAIANQAVSDQPSKRLSGPNKVKLTEIRSKNNPDQTLYDEWLEKTGTTEINGKNLRETLTEMIESRDYKLAPGGDINVTGRGTQGSLIRTQIEAFRAKARSEIPQLMDLIIAEKKGTGELLELQSKQKRELFPSKFNPTNVLQGKRTFEDLLKQ